MSDETFTIELDAFEEAVSTTVDFEYFTVPDDEVWYIEEVFAVSDRREADETGSELFCMFAVESPFAEADFTINDTNRQGTTFENDYKTRNLKREFESLAREDGGGVTREVRSIDTYVGGNTRLLSVAEDNDGRNEGDSVKAFLQISARRIA